jgi:glycosyltransferase involved in cell wall biosynthesis
MLKIGFICPIYDALNFANYTQVSLESFFRTTPNGVAIVVDDGSAKWDSYYVKLVQNCVKFSEKSPNPNLHVIHFPANGGLTRSWNAGLDKADRLNLDYAIAGNNDIIFTDRWYEGMVHALANGYSIVGPLSNAPGITANGKQEVSKYVKNYKLTDDEKELNTVAKQLHTANLGKVVESKINGFFQMATLESWRKGKFDAEHYYKPVNTHTSKGKKNATPLMTLNEDELQARWSRKGMKSAISLSTFIFHYRAVSRGDKYKMGKWYRQS